MDNGLDLEHLTLPQVFRLLKVRSWVFIIVLVSTTLSLAYFSGHYVANRGLADLRSALEQAGKDNETLHASLEATQKKLTEQSSELHKLREQMNVLTNEPKPKMVESPSRPAVVAPSIREIQSGETVTLVVGEAIRLIAEDGSKRVIELEAVLPSKDRATVLSSAFSSNVFEGREFRQNFDTQACNLTLLQTYPSSPVSATFEFQC